MMIFSSLNRQLLIQGSITLLVTTLLYLFFTGNPASALLPLWGNPYELRNAAIVTSVTLAMTAAAYLGGSLRHALMALALALMLMAGPAAVLLSLLTATAATALGFQLVGPQIGAQLARSSLARFALAFWIGKACYVLLLTSLSFFPINNRFSHALIPLLLLLISRNGLAEIVRILRCNLFAANDHVTPRRRLSFPAFFFLLSALLLIFAAVHPGFDGDAMTMHMRIARELLNQGLWAYDVQEYVFSVMPLAPQLNFASLFVLGGTEAVKVELIIQFLLTLALVVTGGGFRPRPLGIVIAAVLCLVPMFVREVAGLFTEITLCGFMLSAAVLFSSALRHRSLTVSAFTALCAAGAAATKPFGLLLVPLVTLLLAWAWHAESVSEKKLKASLTILLAIALGSCFYLVAFLKTGNPFFPFLNGLFKSTYWDPVNFLDRRWVTGVSINLPWLMTFDSSKYEESASGSMGLSILFLAICSTCFFLIRRRNLVASIPLALGVFYLAAVLAQVQYLRYLLPGLLLIATSCAYYMQYAIPRLIAALWIPTLISLVAANIFGLPSSRFLNGLMHIPVTNLFIAGSYRGIISNNFAEESLDAHRYLGQVLSASARATPTVLMLGCSYGAHFSGRTIYTNWVNHSWKRQEPRLMDPAAFQQYIDDNAVTHVTIDGCTTPEQRANLVPIIKANYTRIAELWGAELYSTRK